VELLNSNGLSLHDFWPANGCSYLMDRIVPQRFAVLHGYSHSKPAFTNDAYFAPPGINRDMTISHRGNPISPSPYFSGHIVSLSQSLRSALSLDDSSWSRVTTFVRRMYTFDMKYPTAIKIANP
jgi:hypothetical protein